MQHVPDPDLAVAELARVTAPGGRVCLIDTDWDSFLMDGVPTDLLAQLRQAASLTGATLTTAGRFLRGRMVRAGLTEVTAEPVAIAMTDRHTVQALVPYFSRRVIHDVLRVPGELADAWFSAVDESLARGDFLAVFTMWVAAGTKAA
jgi:ubiquinone/menaquinone biosynthesis C-methylase UbiE